MTRETCLVVDDQGPIRSALRRIIESAGLRAIEAESGPAALRELESNHVNLVITDIRMPGMDGTELLAEIRRRWPDTPVVMLTSVSEVDTAVDCLLAGAFDYLTKPFEHREVMPRLNQALQRQRLIQENRMYRERLEDLVSEQAGRIEDMFLQAVQMIVHALEARDAYTHGHSARVAEYARRTAEQLGMDSDAIKLVVLGAELHDIGKIGINETILLKPSALTDDEYRHIQRHTIEGERILSPLMESTPEVLQIVRWHHERLDGKGFPDGIPADRIPLGVRIVTVVDTFDAMTTGRPYRPARSAGEALDELARCSGTQFDTDVVAAFRAVFPDGEGLPISTPAAVGRVVPGSIAASNSILRPRD